MLKAPVYAVVACSGLYITHTHNHSCPSHYTAISALLSQPEAQRAQGSTSHFLFQCFGKQLIFLVVSLKVQHSDSSANRLYVSPCKAMTDVVEG